jgi:cytochrome b561
MMTPLPAAERYSMVAVWFHWTIALLVIGNLAIGLLHESLLSDAFWMHKALGMTVLVLTLGRVAWRIGHRPPDLPDTVHAHERRLAHVVHWALYALMLALPLTGWMMVSGAQTRRPFTWFGLFDLPYLPIGPAAGGFGHEAHEILGWAMLALVVLHIAGALRHHLLLRDETLVRIAPVLRRR